MTAYRLAGLVLCFIACFILLVVAPLQQTNGMDARFMTTDVRQMSNISGKTRCAEHLLKHRYEGHFKVIRVHKPVIQLWWKCCC